MNSEQQGDGEEPRLLTSVAVMCREFPRLSGEHAVVRRIEGFADYSQRYWFGDACGKSLRLAKRVFMRRVWSRTEAAEGLCQAGHAERWDVLEWLRAVGEHVGGVSIRELATEESVWGGSLLSTTKSVSVMRWLVGNGVPMNKSNAQGRTVLHESARVGHLPMVKFLLDNGAEVGAKDNTDQTALHFASSVRTHSTLMVQLLVEHGARVFDRDSSRQSALYKALIAGNFEVVKFFLEKCCYDENPSSTELSIVLFHAARENQEGIIRHLVDKWSIDISIVCRRGTTALFESVAAGAVDSVQILLDRGADALKPNNFGMTPVMEASRQCHLDVLRLLLEHGGKVCEVDQAGRTALHYAADGVATSHRFILAEGSLTLIGPDAIIRELVEHGADVDCSDKVGWTPLHLATANDRVEAVAQLIASGTNVMAETVSNKTALIISLERGFTDATQCLREAAFAEPNSQDRESADYSEYLIDPSAIHFDYLHDNPEGEWLGSPIHIKPVESWLGVYVAEEVGRWSRLNHPHIVKLYGFFHDKSRQDFLVHECLNQESLLGHELDPNYNREECWDKLYEAALGLQYLHDRNVVHGDISCYSIAIGANGDAKLRNFGRDNVPASHRYLRSSAAAPEVLSGLPSTFESDVYAFGITIIQVVSRTSDPWGLSGEARNRVILSGFLPEKPVKMASAQWQLVTRMCCLVPEDRLSATDVVRQLEVFTSKHRTTNCGAMELDWGPHSWSNLGLEHAENSTVLLEVAEMCAGSATLDAIIHQVYERLVDVSDELKGTSDDQLELIQQFSSILRYYHKRLQSTRSVGKAEGARFAASRSGADDTYSVHRELDSFMDTALLSRSSKVHQWRDQWNQLRNQQQHEIMEKLTDFPTLFEDIDDAREREEVLTYLRFELSKYPSRYVMSSASKFTQAKSVISSLANFKNANWFIPQYEVEFDKFNEFSSGSFGSVHRGQWKHAQVVVKKLKLPGSDDAASSFGDTFEVESKEVMDVGSREEIEATFINEVEIWHKLFHPHVVQLFGACHVGQPFFVCEYASGGQLDDYLSQHPNEVWSKLHEAALGLRYLHSKHIIHADLKCNNILIGRDGYAKLTDFGLSEFDTNKSVRSEAEEDGSQHVNIGAIRWKAPEVLRGEKNTFESDIYSFGMCILEAVSGDYPWGRVLDPVVKYYVLQERRIPRRPTKCSEEAYDLVQRMCRYDPNERTGIKQVADALKSFC